MSILFAVLFSRFVELLWWLFVSVEAPILLYISCSFDAVELSGLGKVFALLRRLNCRAAS